MFLQGFLLNVNEMLLQNYKGIQWPGSAATTPPLPRRCNRSRQQLVRPAWLTDNNGPKQTWEQLYEESWLALARKEQEVQQQKKNSEVSQNPCLRGNQKVHHEVSASSAVLLLVQPDLTGR